MTYRAGAEADIVLHCIHADIHAESPRKQVTSQPMRVGDYIAHQTRFPVT